MGNLKDVLNVFVLGAGPTSWLQHWNFVGTSLNTQGHVGHEHLGSTISAEAAPWRIAEKIVVWCRGPSEWFSKRCMVLENGQVESFRTAPVGSHWGAGWVLWVWSSFALEPCSRCCSKTGYHIQGSCAGLEFKASLEKSLNFIKLKMSLNCFGKRVEGLEKFGICLCETFNKTWWFGDCENFMLQLLLSR